MRILISVRRTKPWGIFRLDDRIERIFILLSWNFATWAYIRYYGMVLFCSFPSLNYIHLYVCISTILLSTGIGRKTYHTVLNSASLALRPMVISGGMIKEDFTNEIVNALCLTSSQICIFNVFRNNFVFRLSRWCCQALFGLLQYNSHIKVLGGSISR